MPWRFNPFTGNLDETDIPAFTGEVTLGSAASPSIFFTGDPNTGIYSPGADQVALSTNGTGRLFVDAAGSVRVEKAGAGGVEVVSTIQSTIYFSNAARTGGYIIGRSIGSDNAHNLFSYDATNSDYVDYFEGGPGGYRSFYTDGDERLRITSTGQLSHIGAGSTGSPAVSFNGSAPSNSLVITSAGFVGVGTSVPDAKLEVVDTASSLTYPIAVSNFTDPAANVGAAVDFRLTTGGNSRGYIACRYTDNTAAGGTYLSFAPNDGSTGNVERMRITKTGLVGIGTISVNSNLHIRPASGDDSAFTNGVRVERTDTPGQYGLFSYTGGAATITAVDTTGSAPTVRFFRSTNGSTTTESARIDSNGRLLVGTSSASGTNTLFESSSTTANAANVALVKRNSGTANQAGQQLHFYNFGPAGTARAADTEIGSMRFYASQPTSGAAQETASIICAADALQTGGNTQGRLVFSTTADGASSPTERLRISQNAQMTYNFASDDAFRLVNSTATGKNGAIQIYNSGAFNNFSALSFNINSNGDVTNLNNSYGAISDIKLKENIVDANSQWDDIKALQVRNYNFKEGQTHTQIGLIAQEVELVSPGLVSESPDRDEDGNDLGTVTKSVNYSVLYMKAVKALQEAMERIETLEAKVAALESA